MIESSTESLIPQSYSDIIKRHNALAASPMGCDGISEKTCCTHSIMDKIARHWNDVTKMDNSHPFFQYMNAVDSIFGANYQKIVDYADSNIVFLRIQIAKNRKKNAETILNSFTKVRQKNFTTKAYLEWKTHAKECYDHMAKVAKGAFCSVCDLEENSRISSKYEVENNDSRFLDPPGEYGTKHRRMQQKAKENDTPKPKWYKIFLSTGDAFAFSNKCYDYVASSRKLLKF